MQVRDTANRGGVTGPLVVNGLARVGKSAHSVDRNNQSVSIIKIGVIYRGIKGSSYEENQIYEAAHVALLDFYIVPKKACAVWVHSTECFQVILS